MLTRVQLFCLIVAILLSVAVFILGIVLVVYGTIYPVEPGGQDLTMQQLGFLFIFFGAVGTIASLIVGGNVETKPQSNEKPEIGDEFGR